MANPIATLMQLMHKPIYESRLRCLVDVILPQLQAGDRVLDVGCGFGHLGRALMDDPRCPKGVQVSGLERFRRDEQLIDVEEYDGSEMPYEAHAFDVVILADVLHHEAAPHRLIDQCKHVSRRLLIIKDHKIDGPLAQHRTALIDWAANAPYGVPCLYTYNTLEQWRHWHREHDLQPLVEMTSMNLYPPLVNLLCGRRLQYLAILQVHAERGARRAD